ncbi:MAG: basic amino acid ABC transporter substrate-binding protein [Clostridia bacterium]|nr:basic amino acid ABC transporter substrate-binding protein [Clostridia bacterium]
MKKFLKGFMTTLLVLGLAVSLTGCGGQANTGSDGEKKADTTSSEPAKTKIVVGSEAAYAPFEFVDEKTGEVVGFDAELIKAIGEAVGLEVEIKNTAWKGLIPGLEAGTLDAVISAMTITDERKQNADFSDPYFTAYQFFAVKEGSTIKIDKDLVGKKVGVQTNTTGHYAVEKIEGVKDSDIKKFDTTPLALIELQNGKVEAVVADSPVVLEFINKNPEAKIVAVDPKLPGKDEYGIAIKKGNAEVLAKINEGLKKVKDSGKYDEIYAKYFGTK